VKKVLYRGRLAVLVDMLKAIQENGRLRSTHIMYKANLSHKLLKECLQTLTANGFVEATKNNNVTYYIITAKGEEFILEFSKLKKLTHNFEWPS
jgi:predicted transcriptional regulator